MELMTTAELAAYLRLKERSLYELAAKRRIPCTRATGKLLFPRHLVDRWLEAHTDLSLSPVAPPPPIYAGSSDPLLEWALRESGSGLATITAGSRDGLARLAAGQAVLAGVHILDPETGAYNMPAIRRELPYPDIVAVRWARRFQGLLVAPENPLALGSLDDVARRGARLALRPPDSGSRTLFDTLTERAGLDPAAFVTSEREAQTEDDLAAMIADGEADCGIAVEAAARRLRLGFVPLGVAESFDLVMRRRDYFEPPAQKLLSFARSDRLQARAETHGGYDLASFGEVVFNG